MEIFNLVKVVSLSALMLTAVSTYADTPKKSAGCGWGNMLFEGQKGLGPYVFASTTNGTLGNATFGMTSGTNGCDTSKPMGYGGHSLLAMNGMLDGIAEDMARGKGEYLDSYSALLGVDQKDQAYFAKVTHAHYGEIFSAHNLSSEQVLSRTLAVMSKDAVLMRYSKL